MSRRIIFFALAASATLIATQASADRECFEDSCRHFEVAEPATSSAASRADESVAGGECSAVVSGRDERALQGSQPPPKLAGPSAASGGGTPEVAPVSGRRAAPRPPVKILPTMNWPTRAASKAPGSGVLRYLITRADAFAPSRRCPRSPPAMFARAPRRRGRCRAGRHLRRGRCGAGLSESAARSGLEALPARPARERPASLRRLQLPSIRSQRLPAVRHLRRRARRAGLYGRAQRQDHFGR